MNGGKLPADPGYARSIYKLVDQQEIALEKRPLHAAAGDLERLDSERANNDEQRQGDDDDLCPVGKERELPAAPPVRALEGMGDFFIGYYHCLPITALINPAFPGSCRS